MTEDKENVLQPQRKNSGKGARGRRRGSGPAASGGVKEGEGESGKPRRLAAIRPRISIEELRNAYKRQASTPQEEILPMFDPMAKAQESKGVTRGRTGLVYDERMANHRCLWDANYPECPERLTHTLDRCQQLGLTERCELLPPRGATEEEILKVHSRSHLYLLWNTKDEKDEEKLETISSRFDSVYVHPETYDLALLAAGSTIDLVDSVMAGRIQNGMALIRPPGHHAMKTEFCGYCFFNNVALAAQVALEKHKMSRILIVDWDVHHGQGTQQMFYEDPRVLYFSIHRYENGTFWPELRESDYDNVGAGRGRGFNFNVPLNKTQMKNEDYLAIFHQVLLPVAYEFDPELVLVSSGYDAAVGDEKGEMEITPAFYAHLTSSLMALANGRVAVIFEGGYCLESLAEGAALTLSALMGDPCPKLVDPITKPSLSICESLLNLIYVQRPYWKCFQYQGSFSVHEKTNGDAGERHIPTLSYLGNATKPLKYETRNCYPVQSQEDKEKIRLKLARLKQDKPPQMFGNNRLCLVYDEAMSNHHSLSEKEHPERPERTERIWKSLKQFGIIERATILKSRYATQQELELIHTSEHVNLMTSTSLLSEQELMSMQEKYKSIYLHPKSNDAALLAAGSLLQVIDDVCSNKSLSGIGVVRPPGHHAEQDHPHGFCLYNNVAIAAKYAITHHGYERVLILDWDVHHGNGVQHAFEADPKVLYISIHRYDHGLFFPSSEDANYDQVGSGDGEGYTVNIPWNKSGMGDAEYMSAMLQVVMPIAYQYDPQLVLVSAGFDAARGDPLGGCRVTPECYGHMTRLLSSLAGGRMVLALEGGYNLSSISYCMTMCAKALLGDPLPSLEPGLVPNKNAVQSISDTIRIHKKYWTALSFQVDLPVEDVLCQGFGGGAQPVESGASGSEVSSCNVSPVSTPSTASPPYVSAPSSPDKILKNGNCMDNGASPQLVSNSERTQIDSDKMDIEVTPNPELQRSVRNRVKSEKAASASVAEQRDVKAVGNQKPFGSAGNPRMSRRKAGDQGGTGESTDHTSTPTRPSRPVKNVGLMLRAAASCAGLVKGATAIVCSENACEACSKATTQHSGSINEILKQCKELKLLQSCMRLEPRPASEEEVLSVHTKETLEGHMQKGTCGKSPCLGDLAMTAAGSFVELVSEVIQGNVLNGLALVQVSDHNRSGNQIISNNYINNVAIATQYVLDNAGLQRVLIVNCNAQYGYNTQNLFYSDPRVLMFSINLNDDPNVNKGSVDRQGEDKGLGYTFNLNLGTDSQSKSFTEGDYLAIFHQLILPVSYEFCPELILFAIGNDLVHQSPAVSPLIYSHVTQMLMPLAQGRLAVMLEVGSAMDVTKDIAAATLSALQDKAVKLLPVINENTSEVQGMVVNMISVQQATWRSLKQHAQASCNNVKKQANLPSAVLYDEQQRAVKAFDGCVTTPTHTLCLAYDEGMMEHFSYDDETHPERPERISCIFQRLQEFGIVGRCHRVKARLASAEELETVHSAKHIKFMSNLHSKKPRELQGMQNSFESIFFHRQSNNAALLASGSLLEVVTSVLKGESRRGLAVIRPPGHHAEKNEPCGFCMYNNVAVAAKHAIGTHGLSRVLIVDWDVHHGNGIQHMFEDDPHVLYVSIHRYDNGKFFPGSPDANYNRAGTKKGKGYNINIPWNKGGMGDGDYMAAMIEVILPVACQFNPELVLVSAGFDAAVGDPLGGCKVSPECYGHMTKLLSCLAGGRVIIALEGGYNLNTISYCMTMCAKALLGDPLIPLGQGLAACPSACETLNNVVSVHQKFWSALDLKSKGMPASNQKSKKTTKQSPSVDLVDKSPESPDGKTGLDEITSTLSQMSLSKEEEGTRTAGGVPDVKMEEDGAVGGASATSAEGLNTFLLTEFPGAESMYAVVPLQWCPHLELVKPVPNNSLDAFSPCEECSDLSENWVCLTCYKVLCGRFVNEHMLMHGVTEEHYMVLSYADLSVWCYSCDSYIHHEILLEAKRAAHISKFGEDIPGL
ncbi:histone deacetylase 6-like isoform X3 [Penaeus japonicus]|uniref:histone deacetylase 6-like isoform X3 n=1 Tax=Penaeus japonicus TaxID=27405 RepID=UPI001C70B1DD|nr:histone deacetylase 6-like isoform X3 [Penaeus japonicus]